jgi:outer membrane protein TolC
MFVRLCCVAILLFAGTVTRAVAQGAPAATPPMQPAQLPASGSVVLGLPEAIATAIARNPALAMERLRVEAANQDTRAERGTLREPQLNISQAAYRRDNIVASRFYPTGLYVDSEYATRVSVESKTQLGGSVTFGVDYRQLTSTSNIQTLSPQYSANLVFGVTQPLLRDFGYDAATTKIRLSTQRALLAEQAMTLAAARLISQTEEEYWRWTYAREQADVRRRSRDAAKRLLTQADTLFSAGRSAPLSVQQARAALAQREEDVIGSAADAESVEDRLKLLLRIELTAQLAATGTVAAPAPAPSTPTVIPAALTTARPPAPIDPVASVESALRRRPELMALEREREAREIELSLARNQLLPRLDLTAQYIRNGMAGLPNLTCTDPTAIECIPAGSGVSDSIFAGMTAPSDALGSLFGRHPFDGWSAELRLQIPLGMSMARARRAEAELKLAESQVRLTAARDEVIKDVRETVRQAATAQARFDAAREVAAFARTQFTSARTQFDAGLVSTYDVVRMQDELDRATLNELRTQMELNIALGKVRLADMTILDDHGLALGPRVVAGTK